MYSVSVFEPESLHFKTLKRNFFPGQTKEGRAFMYFFCCKKWEISFAVSWNIECNDSATECR